jgi:hypothetical protein
MAARKFLRKPASMGIEPMDNEAPEPRSLTAPGAAPVAPDDRARRRRGPFVVDGEFRVLSPAWGLWRRFRDSWWALGPYLAYCTALWGLAALVGWLIDRGRAG